MAGRAVPRALTTAGWATIGLLTGHVAAYDVVYPDAHVHATALEASGHGWLSALGPTLVLASLAVLGAAFLGARSGRPRAVLFRTLALIQITGFVAIELGERLSTGLPPSQLGHQLVDHGAWQVLVVGVLIQVMTAWLGSAVSRGIATATTPRQARQGHRSPRAPLLVLAVDDTRDRGPLLQRRSRAPPTWFPFPRPIRTSASSRRGHVAVRSMPRKETSPCSHPIPGVWQVPCPVRPSCSR